MKQLSALKLKDLVSTQLDLSEMGLVVLKVILCFLLMGVNLKYVGIINLVARKNVQLIRVIHLHVKVVHKPY